MISQLFRRKTDFSINSNHQLPRILSVRDLTFFGIAAIGENGHESIVSFPTGIIKK